MTIQLNYRSIMITKMRNGQYWQTKTLLVSLTKTITKSCQRCHTKQCSYHLIIRSFSFSFHILFLILDSSICQAVSQYVRNKQVTHDSHMTTVNIHLLEDHQDVPLEILQSNDPIVIIRYCI